VRFQNTFVSEEHRYAPGNEEDSGHHFAAIPVASQIVDYIESYKISDDEYDTFVNNQERALEFVESCRRHEQDDRLFLQPGSDRGTPI
jgi:hypothetical protein